MNPGLPGTGIGGLFYILCALAMPIVQAWRQHSGDPRATGQWPQVWRQVLLAAAMVLAMSVMFYALDLLIRETLSEGLYQRSSRLIPVVWTSGVLAFVLLFMHVARLWLHRR